MFKQDLLDFSFGELQNFCKDKNLPNFRASQIWRWMYCFGFKSFDEMNNISKSTRELLNYVSLISRPQISEMQVSTDGTIKWLIKLKDNSEVETVYIPQDDRGTVCLSSQVGCTLNCSFCHTGTQALVRNLTSGEIIGQLMIVMDHLNDWPSGKNNRKVTNIVMMGMGEPLLNYDEVCKAIKIMMSDDGIAISRRRITLSTSGIIPNIEKTGIELGLEINNEIDERYHIEKSTKAACQYLQKAYNTFGNWTLAAAAYNMGIYGLQESINTQKVNSYYDLMLNNEMLSNAMLDY